MEFTFEILEHDAKNSFFRVNYIPKDTTLTPITLTIGYPSTEVYTKEQLLDRIITASPQGYWQDELKAREVKSEELMATYGELVGHSQEISTEKLESYNVQQPENNATADDIQHLLQLLQK